MLVRKELGYLPSDPLEMAFVSTILLENNNKIRQKGIKDNSNNKLRGLINKNK